MKFKIHMIYTKKALKTNMNSDWIEDDQIIRIIEDLENTGRFSDFEIEDETGLSWTKKELKKLLKKVEEEPDNIELYFDGSYRKDTQEAGLGTIIYYKIGNELYRERYNAKIDYMESNNEAEYAALAFSIDKLAQLEIKGKKVVIKGDSQGVIMQLKGEWPCYEENLSRWLDKIEDKIKALNLYAEFENIPRNQNKQADRLAQQAVDNQIIESRQLIQSKQE